MISRTWVQVRPGREKTRERLGFWIFSEGGSRHTVGPFFILLNLLERQTNPIGECLLAHAYVKAADSDTVADTSIGSSPFKVGIYPRLQNLKAMRQEPRVIKIQAGRRRADEQQRSCSQKFLSKVGTAAKGN
jgi:hypothetical protein